MFISEYENELARLLRADHAIAFAYGRHALMSIFKSTNHQKGDEVILPSLTCKVVPLVLLALDLRPVYIDISANTLNLDPARVKEAISPATRSILFQHTYGNSTGIEAIAELASQENLLLVEDCAQCLPYNNSNQSPGFWGQAAIFSNNLRKPLPAGSGGVATTNNTGLAKDIRAIRDRLPYRNRIAELILRVEIFIHKYVLRPKLYWILFDLSRRFRSTYKVQSKEREIKVNVTQEAFQASNFQMRVGVKWLAQLEDYASHSQACCADYSNELRGVESVELPLEWQSEPLYYFPIFVKSKQELLTEAKKKHIELIAWPTKTPIYPIEEEQDLLIYGYKPGSCPVAEDTANKIIGLPTHTQINLRERNRIIDFLRSFYG